MELIASIRFGNRVNEMIHREALFHSSFHLALYDVAYWKECNETLN
jgi:hypothetical protein